jgi:hypothetical protein
MILSKALAAAAGPVAGHHALPERIGNPGKWLSISGGHFILRMNANLSRRKCRNNTFTKYVVHYFPRASQIYRSPILRYLPSKFRS